MTANVWYIIVYMNWENHKKFAAGLSILSNLLIVFLKLLAGIMSGCISIISEAIHSVSDCLASVLTFFAVSKSSNPADKEHPFGHGKYEDMSGFIEGGLIIFAGIYIIYEAISRLITNNTSEPETSLGILVMFLSTFANIIVSRYLFFVAKKTDSVSLYADAQHLSTDVYSSVGVLAGLIIIRFTGLYFLDSVIAILVALIIIKAGYLISKNTMNNLLDGSLPEKNILQIETLLKKNDAIKGFKSLKARKSGPYTDIEITVFFDDNMKLYECHNICDEIESEISKLFDRTNVTIHPEPATKMTMNLS